MSEITFHSVKKAYLQEVTRKRTIGDDETVDVSSCQKQGRLILLGESVDAQGTDVPEESSEWGGVVTARIAVVAAGGIRLSCDRSKLAEFGGPITLNRFWAYSLMKRINFVKWKVTTAKSKHAVAEFECLKEEVFAGGGDNGRNGDPICTLF